MPRILIVSLAAFVAAQPAMAASQVSANFTVTINVQKQCLVTPPAALNFGTVSSNDAASAILSATQTYLVNCSKGASYAIGFSSPNDLVAGSAVHQMKGTGSNTDAIQYNLYDSTNGNPVPLDSTTHMVTDTGIGSTQTKSLKAQVINYTAAITPDTYTDTVTMTVTY